MALVGQSLGSGDLREEAEQLIELVAGQGGGDVGVVVPDHLAYGGDPVARAVGEVQLLLSSIGRAATAYDELPVLELVDQLDDPARCRPEALRERLLAQARLLSDDAQRADLRRGEVEVGQALGEACGDVGADPAQQQRGAGRLIHAMNDYMCELNPVAPRGTTDRWLYAVAGVLVVSGLVHLGVFALDDRPWHGPLSWRKPATFGLSFGITLATITWVTSYLRMAKRTRAVLLTVFAVDCVVEVAGITLQAWRDQPSHLNTSTPANAAVAYTLAAGGAVLVVVLGAFAAVALRGRVVGPPSTVLAVRAGFALLLAGLASGVAMIAVGTTAMRTGPAAHAYDVAGFLKGFHAVTLHAILVLPALAWWLERRTPDEPRRLRVVRAAVGAYVAAALVVLAVNLARV
jgi:hypothetical protein